MTTSRTLAFALILAVSALAQDKPGKELKPPADDPPIGKAPIVLMEDFESTEAGQVPKNYTKQGAVGVDDTVAHSGSGRSGWTPRSTAPAGSRRRARRSRCSA